METITLYLDLGEITQVIRERVINQTDLGRHFKVTITFKPEKEGVYNRQVLMETAIEPSSHMSLLLFSMQTIFPRGIGVSSEKPLAIGESSLRSGLPAISVTDSPYIRPGVTYKDIIYIPKFSWITYRM